MSARACVYTALFGDYEDLNEQPVAGANGGRLVCFTDDPNLTSDTWEIVFHQPLFPADRARSVRQLKMLGHAELAAHETTLWMDNSVVLDVPVEAVLDAWLDGADLAFAVHSFRATVLDEFLAVLDDALDDPTRVQEQLEHYLRATPEVLDERPLWGGMIARRWTSEVHAAMTVWWEHTLRYSRRDQLSLNVALDAAAAKANRIDIDNHRSEWHHWPVITRRERAKRHWDESARVRASAVELVVARERLERDADELVRLADRITALESEKTTDRATIDALAEESGRLRAVLELAEQQARQADAAIAECGHELGAMRADRQRLELELADCAAELDRATRQLQAIGVSRSWRVLQYLQRVRVALRGGGA